MRDYSFLTRMNPFCASHVDVRATLTNLINLRKKYGNQFVDEMTPQNLQNFQNRPVNIRTFDPASLSNLSVTFSSAYFYGLLPVAHTEPLDLQKALDFTMVCNLLYIQFQNLLFFRFHFGHC